MPQVVDIRTRKKKSIADAAKAFRETGYLSQQNATLSDDDVVKEMMKEFPDVYKIEADDVPAGTQPPPADVAAPKNFATTERNRGAVTLEEGMKMAPGDFAGAWLGNFKTGAVNTAVDLKNFAFGIPDMMKARTSRGKTIEELANKLKTMNPADEGYDVMFNDLQRLQREHQLPSFTEAAGALIDDYKNRYGSLRDIGKTLYEDPFGVANDAATVAFVGATGGAGTAALAARGSSKAATFAASQAAKSPRLAAMATKAANDFAELSRGAKAVERPMRVVSTFADPITGPISGVRGLDDLAAARFGTEPLRKQVGEGMYRWYSALPDVNPDSLKRAAKAGVGEDGIPFTRFSEETSKLNLPIRLASKLTGDAPPVDSIRNFQAKKINPLVDRRLQIAQDLETAGSMIDGEKLRQDVLESLRRDTGKISGEGGVVMSDEMRKAAKNLDEFLVNVGYMDPMTNITRNLTPSEAHALMRDITANHANRLDQLASMKVQPDVGTLNRFILDNEVRKAIRKQFSAMSPEYDDLGKEAAARIRLKGQAEKLRGVKTDKAGNEIMREANRNIDDPLVELSPSEMYAIVSAMGGGANAFYSALKAGGAFLNEFGGRRIPGIARFLYADPKTKNLAELLLRNAGYTSADIGKILKDSNKRAERENEKLRIHPPRTEYDELTATPMDESKVNWNVPRSPAKKTAPPPENLPERLWQ